MCMACEQGDREMMWELVEIIARGEMPAGYTVANLRAMGLPVPGELWRDVQPDGTVIIRQRAPSEIAAPTTQQFECDSPND